MSILTTTIASGGFGLVQGDLVVVIISAFNILDQGPYSIPNT